MYSRIMVAIDGSEPSAAGLAEAIRVARMTGGDLTIVHVVEPLTGGHGFEPATAYVRDSYPRIRQVAERLLVDARARAQAAGVRAEVVLRESIAESLARLIVDCAIEHRIELIVIGTHGRHGVSRLVLGSDAERVLRLAPMPVLLVKVPGEQAAAASVPTAAATA